MKSHSGQTTLNMKPTPVSDLYCCSLISSLRPVIACLGIALLSALISVDAQAQTPLNRPDIAVRQAEALQRNQSSLEQQKQKQQKQDAPGQSDLPETYPGENADLGPQLLLKPKAAAPQRKPLFEFSSDTMFTWSSNPLSVGGNPQEAGIVAETFTLAAAPEPFDVWGGKLSLRSGYRHLFWVYDVSDRSNVLNNLNFEMSTLFFGSSFSFKENWNASLGMDYNRLLFQSRNWGWDKPLDPSNWKEGYVEWLPNWSLSRNIPLRDKLNLTVGYNGSYHFTRTDPNAGWSNTNSSDRIDSSASVSLMWSFMDKFLLMPSFRYTHSIYTHTQQAGGHRADRTLSPSLALVWSPRPWLSARWSVGGEFRHSSDANTPNSSKLELGTGMSVTIRF
jgi:outer membrane receptor protein involved in Fe transport